MKFTMPKASKKSLEKLLTYLGDRADDFKKCFDVESEWCWKYADLMLRGINDTREFHYREGHHIVPVSFYGKRNKIVDEGNLISLPYGEHLYAHYCATYCGIEKMKGKMARAFYTMYKIGVCKKRPLFPSDKELLASIPELEAKRILSMTPGWKRVEAEGRTHKTEDPVKAAADWRNCNRKKLRAHAKQYRDNNKDVLKDRQKKFYEEHKDEICARQRRYNATKREEQKEYSKEYRKAHPNYHKEYCKKYYDAKKAAGYRRCKNPLTGKRGWVFVGLPETPKSTEVA